MRTAMIWVGLAGAATWTLSACGHLPVRAASISKAGETITYETTRCYGSCPAYVVTVQPDGQGMFEGKANTAVIGRKQFRASSSQVRAFADSLSQIRPKDGHDVGVKESVALCEQVGTDMPAASVRWQGVEGIVSYAFYYGCVGPKAAPIAAILSKAPTLLPIADLIGHR